MKKESREWFKKAEEDYKVLTSRSIWNKKLYNVLCFHGHQYIEKSLKGILTENNTPVEKTHDLELLYHRCKQFLPQLENFKKDLIYLTQFSIRVRYPGFNATLSHAKKTKEIVNKIRKVFEEYIKRSGK